MNEWIELDKFIEQDLNEAELRMMGPRVSVILVKNEIALNSSTEEFQQLLLKKYNVEYTLQDIEEHLFDLRYPQAEDIIEVEEDFFEGY